MRVQQQPAIPQELDGVLVPPRIAAAATRYQTFRVIEAEHLAHMAQYDLSREWTAEVRQVVVAAGDHVRQARVARQLFRDEVRVFVSSLRAAREPLPTVLRRTRALMQSLEAAGALLDDGGWLEAEVLEWAIEEYETVA